jgi:hypothetical protein
VPTHEQQTSVSDLGRAGNHPTLDKGAILAAEILHVERTRPRLRDARVAARDVTQTTRRHARLSLWPLSDEYRRDTHWTSKNGDSFEYIFYGRVEYITDKKPSLGNVSVYIDDKLDKAVSCYDKNLLAQQVVYSKRGLAWGTHTIKVVNGSTTTMILDALKIYQ